MKKYVKPNIEIVKLDNSVETGHICCVGDTWICTANVCEEKIANSDFGGN